MAIRTSRIDCVRMTVCLFLTVVFVEQACGQVAANSLQQPRFQIDVPGVVLTDVPVSRIQITALDLTGSPDTSFNGRPPIQGIELTVQGRAVAIGPFRDGILELETDLASGQRVYVIANEIIVDPDSPRRGQLHVDRIWKWLSVLPPLLAILLAVWLKNVLVALFAAVWSGAVVLAGGDFFIGLVRTLDVHLLGEIVQLGSADKDHMLIILFTMFLGAMVGVMSRSGATQALVQRLAHVASTRERGQLLTWALGLVVFFDDYANTLLVGTTMRPVTDRLRISREKLAFLVDSTAAPVAGLAIISTWVGFEIGQINDAFAGLDVKANGFQVFLSTLPYRFYPLFLIVFVWLIAYTGRDFGPMLKAEARALALSQPTRPESNMSGVDDDRATYEPRRPLVRNAVVPLCTLLVGLVAGLYWTGMQAIHAENIQLRAAEQPELAVTFSNVLSYAAGNRVLFFTAFLSSFAALASVIITKALTLNEAVDSWIEGAKSMFTAIVILVFAWAVAGVCNDANLNTAGFLVELSHGGFSVRWMPALTFLLAAIVSFATGSSFSTMGLLMPLSISVTYHLLVPMNEARPEHHLLLATIGAVLAGAIFGDHCSPISDTTVLSSAASGCDHLDHVATQIPYAGTVALVSLILGYVPLGLGFDSVYLLLPFGVLVMYLVVKYVGRSVAEAAASLKNSAEGAAAGRPGSAGDDDGDGPIESGELADDVS